MQLKFRLSLIATIFAAVVTPAVFAQCERCSPNGLYRLVEQSTVPGRPELVIVNTRGEIQRVLRFPQDDLANAILSAGWRDDRIVWANGHVNPDNGIYYEWDSSNGRVLRSIDQSNVAVSPDGKHVAWVDLVMRPPTPDDDPALAIDEASRAIDVRGRTSSLAWSPHSDEVAVAVESAHGVKVMLFNAESLRMTRSFPLSGATHVRHLLWDEKGLMARTERGLQAIAEP
jgi:hypothetical protein